MKAKLKEQALVLAVRKQLHKWATDPGSRFYPAANAWVRATEGEIYIRFNRITLGVDLANFAIKQKYRRKGIARAIIAESIRMGFPVVRIENVTNPKWGEAVVKYRFDGFETKIKDWVAGCFTVDFVKQD